MGQPLPEGSPPPRVLIVEDDPHVRTLLRRVLAEGGYEVIEASDGRQALGRLEDGAADLLIVDIMMPEVDGVSLARSVKGDPRFARIPVIFLTARSDARSMAEGVDAGARYYVTKPFEVDDVLQKVSRALGA